MSSFPILPFSNSTPCPHCSTGVKHTSKELRVKGEFPRRTDRRLKKLCPTLQTAIRERSLECVLSGTRQLNLTAITPERTVRTLQLWGKAVLESADASELVSFGVRWDQVECVDALDESVTGGSHLENTCEVLQQIK